MERERRQIGVCMHHDHHHGVCLMRDSVIGGRQSTVYYTVNRKRKEGVCIDRLFGVLASPASVAMYFSRLNASGDTCYFW